MTIQTTEIPEHFYTYCALLFNNNESVRYSKDTEILKAKVDKILEANNVAKIDIPDHRYQYLLSVINSNNYAPVEDTRETHYDVLKYIKALSELPDMRQLWEEERVGLSKSLETYNKPLKDISNFFKTYFDFEPKVNSFYVTRNWDKSGMCIPTKKEFYILAGWNSAEPNVRNIIHEITHAYLDEVELQIPENVKIYIDKIPDDLFKNYRKTYTIVRESLVRALVVYLTKINTELPTQEFSEDDISLQLPVKYLEKLEKDSQSIITKDYLATLSI